MTAKEGASTADGDVDIASIGALFADVGRCRMMLALSDGSELSATRLAAEANVTAATASSHLKKLTDAGLLQVTQRGRNRNFRITGPQVADLIEALERVAPVVAVRSLRQSTQSRQWREARLCYHHLAGHLGVALLDAMVRRGYLIPAPVPATPRRGGERPRHQVTAAGAAVFDTIGISIHEGDWLWEHDDSTEHRPHLAGRQARLLADRLAELAWIRRTGQRTVRVTEEGTLQLATILGLSLAD
jgi:DNA-binding transcriptional ArsR family regulator